MSAHSLFTKWSPADEISTGLIEDLANCVSLNNRIKPGAFAIGCWADQIIWVMHNMMLGEDELTDEMIDRSTAGLGEHQDHIRQLMKSVRDMVIDE